MQFEQITFVVLTLDEAQRLERALATVPTGARVFVLDAHSSDDTRAIAARFGARVEVRDWTTFAAARRYAITRVETEWLFMLDADEALTPELAVEIDKADGEAFAGFTCRRDNRFCGRVMRGGAWANERVLRLARTAKSGIVADASGELHEHVAVSGSIGTLDGALDHDSYPSIESYWKKFERYTRIEAQSTRINVRRAAIAIPLAIARATRHYIFKRGYRDGWRGAFVAAASALYPLAVLWRALRANRADS